MFAPSEKKSVPFRKTASLLFAAVVAMSLAGCQAGYLLKSAASQADLLRKRVSLERAYKDPKISDEEKRKLRLAHDAKLFAQTDLGLFHTGNYETFVKLDRPYVTYVVSAAPKNELKPYLWSYPLVGALPYRGYFDPADAKEEAERMKAKGFDVFVRGVSAFSTLGWFDDPILSSMLDDKDWDLVDTIIHETTHATIYIKSEASFNERLATFIGNKGAEAFYLKREGASSTSLKAMAQENEDEKLFSEFISKETNELEAWYKARMGSPIAEPDRQARFRLIQERFAKQVRPHLSAGAYLSFETADLNNAHLLTYRLYVEDLSDFENAFRALGSDIPKFIVFCKSLEKQADPAAALKAAGAKASKETL